MLYLRSMLFNLLMFSSVLFFAAAGVLCFWLPYKRRYVVLTGWQCSMTWLARKLCKLDYQVEGWENLPKLPFLIASNHQSTWETLSFFAIFPSITFVLKKELLHIPIFGWALRLLEPIAVNRKAGKRALQHLLTQGKQISDKGRTVVIFPQGSRVAVGETGQFHIGAAMLAKHLGLPLVPVKHDAGCFWPRRSWLKHPGVISVKIFPPIMTSGRSVSDINQALVKTLTE